MNININKYPIRKMEEWDKKAKHERYNYFISRVGDEIRLHKIDKEVK